MEDRSASLVTSVAKILTDANLYKETGKIEQETLKTIAPDGSVATHLMAEIDYYDLKVLADELDIALKLQNERAQSLYAKNAVSLAQLVRVVNYNTRSGFKGSKASGNALDALLLRPEQFMDPDVNANTARTTWVRNLPSLTTVPPANGNFIEMFWTPAGAAHGVALAMANNEGLALLGFANTSPAPITSAVQITYLGVVYDVQNLSFELVNPNIGDPIIELKQPLFIYPGETALVVVRYFGAGSDELRPIGLWIKTATNARALATS